MLTPSHAFCTREGADEALTGARAGQVLSRESKISSGGPRCRLSGRQHGTVRYLRERFRPRVVVDPVHVRKLLTREPGDPASGLGRWSKVRAVNPEGTRQRCTVAGSRTG